MTLAPPKFSEMQAAELAWWREYMAHPTAVLRMYAHYGARYYGYFWDEFLSSGDTAEFGSGPLPVLFLTCTRRGIAVDTLWGDYVEAGLVAGDLPALTSTAELGDESVDQVLLLNVLDHTSEPETLVAEARRVLRPGGRALLFVHLGQQDAKHKLVDERDVRRWFGDWQCQRWAILHTAFDPPAYVGVYLK